MMSNTPRVFVGTTTFLIAGITSCADQQTVIAAINDFPGVRVVAADQAGGHGDRRPTGESFGPGYRNYWGRLHRVGIAMEN
jgi:hypothetical protein